ncbi:MAG: PEP-CTERM sorting domain-containing protein [Pirellulales bacterium]|nr:PEP-CTERM sorting domain-containing protein [Pirellulales bacterium]
MKYIIAIAVALSLATSSAVQAASLQLQNVGNGVYSLYLLGEELNGEFDTIFLTATPGGGSQFTALQSGLVGGAPRPAGAPNTYRNRNLGADPLDFEDGLGLSEFGIQSTANLQEGTFAALGGTISTAAQPGGRLFLWNFNMGSPSATGSGHVELIRSGVVGANLPFSIVPEPATFVLAGISMLGLAAVRRRMV